MNEIQKTAAFVGVAVVLMGSAVLATLPRGTTPSEFNDQGQLFFPDFKNPLDCTSLEVIDWDATTASATPFKVMLKDGKWVIPSHYNYPADAKDRLSRTAAGVVGLVKDTIRSDLSEDHKALGVVDPLDKKLTSPEGIGKRVTLRDKSDKVLAEFIIGKEVPGRPNQRYVRRPDQTRTYGVNLKSEPSTRFADWIETNLLKLDATKIRKVVFDNHKVDPERGKIDLGEVLTMERTGEPPAWTMQGLAADQELNPDKTSGLTTALGDLKIAGIRPKPEGLSGELKAANQKGVSLTRASLSSLASKGFYLVQGRLLSNQGDVIVSNDDGVVYILRFGEVTFAQGEALSAGSDDSASTPEKAAPGKEKEKKGEGGVESRYLFVTVQFDPSLLTAPVDSSTQAGELPSDPFQRTPSERESTAKAAKEKADRDRADYDRKIADGKKRAQELTDRFAAWYYVVPGDAFRSVVLDRNTLTRTKGAPSAAPPGLPPIPGGFQIPGAHPAP